MQSNVIKWLEQSSMLFPNKTAICDEYETYTFKQYHDKSLGIANEIICSEIGSRKPVVVFMEKSAKVLVSFAAVAYSGNFYTPIDITMPEPRVNKIMEVLNPELVITTSDLKDRFDSFGYTGKYIIYDSILPLEQCEKVEKAANKIIDTDLLYVLFTSGSTGTPKGVSITHRGVIDYIDWVSEKFEISENDNFGNQAPLYFDNSILDIYTSMKTGACVYIIPTVLFSQPVKLLEYLVENNITTIFWVPSALMIVSKLKALEAVDISNTVKRVMFAGEVMPTKQLNAWKKHLPNAMYVNLYGPTEITDACTYYIVDREFKDDEPLPIGFQIDNTEILLLDENHNMVTEPYITGEICIRGTGISPGYYNNTEKTAAAFIQNPLVDGVRDIVYLSGDLAQYNENHELIYLSRKDFQIKHMGHRIELGEIETAVSSLDGVSRCCCLYNEKRSRIVLFADYNFSLDTLQNLLKELIPEYMIPGQVIYLENMPLNANGKIDRNYLKTLM